MTNENVNVTPAGAAQDVEPTRDRRVLIPPTDIRETDAGYLIEMDVPGADKGAVDVTFEDGLLRVRAGAALDERPGFATRLAEFEIADYERAFRVTESVDTDAIAAELKHGVLSIRVPKARPSRRRVEVTAS